MNKVKGNTLGGTGIYMMMYTWNVWQTKQARKFTKGAYHGGVVLIRCEGCDNLHLIADNLGWFRDEKVNIEDLMREKGKLINLSSNYTLKYYSW